MNKLEVVNAYFTSWVLANNVIWDDLFAVDIKYSECYGPCYSGLEQLKRWFHHWQEHGHVISWEITNSYQDLDTIIVEWCFHNIYEEKESMFDGVSVIHFDKSGKINDLKEYQSLLPHVPAII